MILVKSLDTEPFQVDHSKQDFFFFITLVMHMARKITLTCVGARSPKLSYDLYYTFQEILSLLSSVFRED